jgi:hypothetical protein
MLAESLHNRPEETLIYSEYLDPRASEVISFNRETHHHGRFALFVV